VITLELEAAPRISTDAADEWEASRLCDWISNHSDLAELLDLAIEGRESWRRRAAA
jgi:hypothetical protein